MNQKQLKEIRARCEAAKKYWRHVPPSDVFACLDEIQFLQAILREVTTKHSLFKGLSEYEPCKCRPGESLCMKHAAADILNMIWTALEK